MKRIAILTSSRADYGIYLPLLKVMKDDPFFELRIIAFGTHLSPFHGYTFNQIIDDGFEVFFQIESMLAGDSPNAISTAMALTSLKFADFWKDHQNDFDLVFCLGDRYEMFAAVSAGIPFNIQFAHIHGGEKTLGAIDNAFRHAISLSSKYHFVSCADHGKRVAELLESESNIFNVGALALDNLATLTLFEINEFFENYGIDLNIQTILVTVHPETICPEENKVYIEELAASIMELKNYQVIITLPNADTIGNIVRTRLLQLPLESGNRVKCFENLGTRGYFSAMKNCAFLLGNTSSGIIEAASFNKWVINIGDRQKGRHQSGNVLNTPFDHKSILELVQQIEQSPFFAGENIYFKGNVAQKICSILKELR